MRPGTCGADNLWWCWHPDAIELFRRLDPDLWEGVGHNPVALINEIGQEKLKQASEDEGFAAHQHRVIEDFDAYMTEPRWFQRTHGEVKTAEEVHLLEGAASMVDAAYSEVVQNLQAGIRENELDDLFPVQETIGQVLN